MLKVPGCCCFTLETGAKIIGWLVTLFTAFFLIYWAPMCLKPARFESDLEAIILVLIYFIAHALLLLAIHTRNHHILLAVIRIDFLAVILSFILLSMLFSFIGFVFATVINTVFLYCILVKHSLYEKMKSENIVINV